MQQSTIAGFAIAWKGEAKVHYNVWAGRETAQDENRHCQRRKRDRRIDESGEGKKDGKGRNVGS